MGPPEVRVWDEEESEHRIHIEHVEVHATWDGVSGNAARLSYKFQVDLSLDSELLLIDLSDTLIESAAVTSIQLLDPDLCENHTEKLKTHTGAELGSHLRRIDALPNRQSPHTQYYSPRSTSEDLGKSTTPLGSPEYRRSQFSRMQGKKRIVYTKGELKTLRPSGNGLLKALDLNTAPWDNRTECSEGDMTKSDKIHHVPLSLTFGTERSTSGETAQIFLSDVGSVSERGSRRDISNYRLNIGREKNSVLKTTSNQNLDVPSDSLSENPDNQTSILNSRPYVENGDLVHKPATLNHTFAIHNHEALTTLNECGIPPPWALGSSTFTPHAQSKPGDNPSSKEDSATGTTVTLHEYSLSSDPSYSPITSPTRRSTRSSPRKPKQPWQSPCLEDLAQLNRGTASVKRKRGLVQKDLQRLASKPYNSCNTSRNTREGARLVGLLREASSDFADSEVSKSVYSTLWNRYDETRPNRTKRIMRNHLMSVGDGVSDKDEMNARGKTEATPVLEKANPWDRSVLPIDANDVETDTAISRRPSANTRSTYLASQSPAIEPLVWLRHRGASSAHCLPDAVQPLRGEQSSTPSSLSLPIPELDSAKPAWKVEDKKLLLSFGKIIERSVYEVVIEAKVQVTSANIHGWQRLNIPRVAPGNESTISAQIGSFSFCIEPAEYGHKDFELQFDTTSLSEPFQTTISVLGIYDPNKPLFLGLRQKVKTYIAPSFNTRTTTHVGIERRDDCTTVGDDHARAIDRYVRLKIDQTKVSNVIELTTELNHKDVFADYVAFTFILRHCRLSAFTHTLEPGACQIVITDCPSSAFDDEVTAVIRRSIRDVDKGLLLCFTNNYYQTSPFTLRLPTIRPCLGKTTKETILVTRPDEPLLVTHLSPGPVTSWKCPETKDQDVGILRFDRVEMPKFFPQGLQDDVLVKVAEIPAAMFDDLIALEGSLHGEAMERDPSTVVRRVKFCVDRVLGGGFLCWIRVDVEVGESLSVLKIDPRSWIPAYAFIDGKLSTKTLGEWRIENDNHLTLFRSPQSVLGQVMRIGFCFRYDDKRLLGLANEIGNAPSRESDCSMYAIASTREYIVPTIMGKILLGASLKCDFQSIKVTTGAGVDTHEFLHAVGKNHRKLRLPRLGPDYSITVTDLCQSLTSETHLKDSSPDETLVVATPALGLEPPLSPVISSPRKFGPGVRVRFADEEPERNDRDLERTAVEQTRESDLLQEVEIFPEDFAACGEECTSDLLPREESLLGNEASWVIGLFVAFLTVLFFYSIDARHSFPGDWGGDLGAAFDQDTFLLDDLTDVLSFDLTGSIRAALDVVPWSGIAATVSRLLIPEMDWGGVNYEAAEEGISEEEARVESKLETDWSVANHEAAGDEAIAEEAHVDVRPEVVVDENSQRTRAVGEALEDDQDHSRGSTSEIPRTAGEATEPRALVKKIWTWRDRIDYALGWKPVEGQESGMRGS